MHKPETKDTFLQKTLLVFAFIFASTLAVSIFLNQIGYYGALICLLAMWWVNKKNPFFANGLEPLLLLYILAVLISVIFTNDKPEGFHNLLKRFLLIPIIYTFSAGISSEKKLKQIYYCTIWAAAIAGLVYLGFTVHSISTHEFERTQTGPDVFQGTITASQMFSYSFMLAFGLLIGGELKGRQRTVILILSLILMTAVIATYRRTGWIGFGIGILSVLFIARKWKYAIAAIILFFIVYFMQVKESRIVIFEKNNSKIIKTDGRAAAPLIRGENIFVCDYEKGIKQFSRRGELIRIIDFGQPVQKLIPINDSLFGAMLYDFSVQLLKYDGANISKLSGNLLSPGSTTNIRTFGGALYFIDTDSGLTVYNNPRNPASFRRIALADEYTDFSLDSNYLFVYQAKNRAEFYKHQGTNLPGRRLSLPVAAKDISSAEYCNGRLFVADGNTLTVYRIEDTVWRIRKSWKTGGTAGFSAGGDKMNVIGLQGNIYEYSFLTDSYSELHPGVDASINPSGYAADSLNTVLTQYKRSRLLGLFDRYNYSYNNRVALWRGGLLMFRDHPWFGVGDIDIADYFIHYKRASDKEVRGHLHNNFVHILATLGIFGFVIFILLLLIMAAKFRQVYKFSLSNKYLSSYALGAAGVFIAFIFSGLTEWNFGDHESVTYFWYSAALIFAIRRLILLRNSSVQS